MEPRFKRNSFGNRLGSMLKVDFRRMFTMPLLYIMMGSCLAIPILTLVMTAMMGGEGADAGMFQNTWQIIGTVSSEYNPMSMDMTTMCSINLLYFFAPVLVCLFVSADFKTGYAKNLFTVRAKKSDYVISKTLVGLVGASLMLVSFFVGSVVGGAIGGLSFDPGAAGVSGVVMCMLCKIFLMAVFVAIDVALSAATKQKTWMALIGAFCVGMLLFMMIPMITPLDATITNVIICLVAGALFSLGLGAVSNLILGKTSLV